MKHLNKYSWIFLIFIAPCISYALIKELSQFQQSLQRVTPFLGKPQTSTSPTKPPITEKQFLDKYEDLKQVVNNALNQKNPNLLDDYKQTISVTTAKYLLQEYLKEENQTGKSADYIPFIAYMVQEVVDRYPDKNAPLHCISLDRDLELEEKLLENEFLLIRALVHLGYKNIVIIPMNLWYSDMEYLQSKFYEWINTNIPSALKVYISLGLLPDGKNEYIYILDVKKGEAPKNNLFYMINSSNRDMQKENSSTLLSELTSVFKKYPNTNFLSFEKAQATKRIEIYLPYSPSDIFINTTIPNTKNATDALETFIKNTGLKDIKDPFYQRVLIENLIANFYSSILGTEIARGRIGVNIDLFFLDLIQHTAINPKKPLAFRSLGADPDMTQITDMSGTLQEIYKRYKRP